MVQGFDLRVWGLDLMGLSRVCVFRSNHNELKEKSWL